MANRPADTRTAAPAKGVSRRQFLRISGAFGLGLAVAGSLRGGATAAGPDRPGPITVDGEGQPAVLMQRRRPSEIDAYLKIGPDGTVTLYTGKLEFGQGIQTGFAQLAAEELDVPFERVNVVMGITDRTPWDLGTFGSLSTRSTGPVIRQGAAELHQWLLELGADRLGLSVDQVHSANGAVVANGDASKSVPYADLAAGKVPDRTVQGTAALKDPSRYTVVGQSIPRVDLPDKVNGKVKFAYDMTVPGMVHGKIVRAPSWGAKLASIDFSVAQSMPGVVGVFHDGDFAGLAAERHEQAEAALDAVKATWTEQHSPYTSENIHDALKSTADAGKAIHPAAGDAGGALTGAAKTVKVTVRSAYVAHAPLEPMTALVNIQPDKTEVWISTQDPFAAQDAVAKTLNLPREQVIVYPPASGGAYGRKTLTDQVVEVARLAQALGRPVRINRTREEEFQLEWARPAMQVEVTAGLDGQGGLTAWDWGTYSAAYFPEGASAPTPAGADNASNVQDYYDIPNARSTFYQSVSPLPVTFWRANGSPVNTLARESAMDELAEAAGVDPVSFREKALQSHPRLLAVMRAAVEKSGWKPGIGMTGQGYGLGLGFADNTYVAEVAKVQVDQSSGKIQVQHVYAAVDAGLLVNPMAARHQVEGSIVSQGTSSTLFEQLTFAGGKITNPSFAQYNPLGFLDAPAVDVSFIEDKTQPMQGMGEPAVTPVSAAISNAVYDLVGVRLRDLPFLPSKVLAALKSKAQT
jgi:nicotinate dehydrogenase subunit B